MPIAPATARTWCANLSGITRDRPKKGKPCDDAKVYK